MSAASERNVAWNEDRLTVFVTASGKGWQIVSRFGVKGEYETRKKAVGEALRIASRHGAKQVLAQSNAGKYKRVWPKFSAVRPQVNPTEPEFELAEVSPLKSWD